MKAGFDHGLRLALYQPDIPQNAGTMLRTCACLGIGADLIEPADTGVHHAPVGGGLITISL